MKKLNQVVLTLLMVISLSTVATAQKTVIKANILSPIVRTGSFFLERSISEGTSLQLGVLYSSLNEGVAITPEVRFYLSENVERLNGFYMAPFLRYQNYNLWGAVTGEANGDNLGAGLVIGAQKVLKKNIVFDAFIGPKIGAAGFTDQDIDLGVVGLRAGVSLGIAF